MNTVKLFLCLFLSGVIMIVMIGFVPTEGLVSEEDMKNRVVVEEIKKLLDKHYLYDWNKDRGEEMLDPTPEMFVRGVRDEKDPYTYWISKKQFKVISDDILFGKKTSSGKKTKAVGWKMVDSETAYIRIYRFSNDNTAKQFCAVRKRILKRGAENLILDFRNNRGGSKLPAMEIAQEFLKPRDLIFYTIDNKKKKIRYIADKKRVGKSSGLKKVVVLVNRGTFSSAEIVVGVLKDYSIATIIGQRTGGKGTKWDRFDLSDGSVLTLTTARWYTPNGYNVKGKGIIPDIETEVGWEYYRALSHLKKKS